MEIRGTSAMIEHMHVFVRALEVVGVQNDDSADDSYVTVDIGLLGAIKITKLSLIYAVQEDLTSWSPTSLTRARLSMTSRRCIFNSSKLYGRSQLLLRPEDGATIPWDDWKKYGGGYKRDFGPFCMGIKCSIKDTKRFFCVVAII